MSAALLRVAAEIAAAGVERLAADLSTSVTASEAAPVTLDEAMPGDAVVARSPLTGAVIGDILTIVSAADLGAPVGDGPPDLHLADPLLAGASAALAAYLGAAVEVGAAEPLPEFDATAVPAEALCVNVEITVGESAAVPVLWVFPATLAGRGVEPQPAVEEAPAPLSSADPVGRDEPEVTVAAASFPELGAGAAPNGMRDLSVLADVAMDVTVELGRARLRVRDLLSLQTGSIVELDRSAGAAVDVLVNGTIVAQGDVVVIDDDLGVRITEVMEAS